MDQTAGQHSIPLSGSLDKSRVLNIRPLRCLVPIFPSSRDVTSFATPQAAPFVCAPPSGPFPPGVVPFYPFFDSVGSQRPPEQSPQTPVAVPNQAAPSGYSSAITPAVPITSFRTPPSPTPSRSHARSQSGAAIAVGNCNSDNENQGVCLCKDSMHVTDEEDTIKAERPKNKSQKRTRGNREFNFALPDIDTDSVVNGILSSSKLIALDTFQGTDGDKELVEYVLLIYNSVRRKISQIEDAKEAAAGVARRPDLRAGTILMTKGIRSNNRKKIGMIPGVEVGDIFFFRMELCLVGLHGPSMAGIDYVGLKTSQDEEPVAVSIVSSGGYEDNVEDSNVLIYSGQGGNVHMDQKLERGNLALEKSVHRGNEVRVIRGIKDIANPTGKVYVYDGLYKIQESWVEKGKSGFNVFKYKLIRIPGQPEAFMVWKSIQQYRDGTATRVGIILPDLTSGAENLPISLVNDVDDEKGPACFTYYPSLKYSRSITSLEPDTGCTCPGGCLSGNPNCRCIQKNGGYLPYSANGVLVSPKSLIYECGPSCQCPLNCRNRVSQGGLKVRLEVFKTKDKGWGLRSWDPIRAGTFICEYAGEVIDISKLEELGNESEDDYIFDATRTYQPIGVLADDCNVTPEIPFPLIISARNVGNVARFMNHSCSPNVFWQPILRENNQELSLNVVFHAIKHIPPMTELTYNYGMVPPDKADKMKKKCLCGSSKCRGYFF